MKYKKYYYCLLFCFTDIRLYISIDMINEIIMWSAECDSCKTTYELYDGMTAYNEKSAISDDIKDSNEWVVLTNGKTYCPDCHTSHWNEEIDENEAFSKDNEHKGSVLLGVIE